MITPHFGDGGFQTYLVIFFLGIALFTFLILDLAYIIFNIKKKNTHITWSVTFLHVSSELLVSILFLPFFDLFIFAFYCQKTDDGRFHKVFTDIECYKGNHVATVICGALAAVILLLYTGVMALILFGARNDAQENDANAKASGRGEYYCLLYKTIIVLAFVILDRSSYQAIFLIIIILGSIQLFHYYSFNIIHHNQTIRTIITSQYACNMWTTICLTLAYLTEKYPFDGGSIIWLCGLPMIILVIASRENQKLDILLIDTNTYEVVNQPLEQLPYINSLLSRYHRDKNIQLMLDGFIDYHRNFCNKDDCPTKRRIMKTTKFSKALRSEGESEQYIMLLAVIQFQFYFALQRFPNNTKLRIIFALYLVQLMRSKQQALSELINTESERPAFDEEFQIYRYKLIVEAELMDSTSNVNTGGGEKKTDGNLEMINELSVRNHVRACKKQIEKSANLHVEFWSQLKEDNPDLEKLSDIGYLITLVNSQAEEQWNKLLRINAYIPSLMRYYAKFLSEILNDKEQGQFVLQKLSDLNTRNQASKHAGTTDLSTESKPTVVISAEDDSFGQVSNSFLQV